MKPGPQSGRGRNGDDRSFVEKAALAWGTTPDWVKELAAHADAHGLKGAGKALSCSPSLVSNVINNKYPGDVALVSQKVRGALMGAVVTCPGVGAEMQRDTCLKWQASPKAMRSTSSHAMLMYRACRNGCPNFRKGGSDGR